MIINGFRLFILGAMIALNWQYIGAGGEGHSYSIAGYESKSGFPAYPQIIELVSRSIGLLQLKDSCNELTREEKRFWLMSEVVPSYLLILRGPSRDMPIDGEMYSISQTKLDVTESNESRDGPEAKTASNAQHLVGVKYAPEQFNWMAVATIIYSWEEISNEYYERGKASSLTLVIETCREKKYSVYSLDTSSEQNELVEAAPAITGFILSLAEGEGEGEGAQRK